LSTSVRELVAQGAQLVDVLPEETFIQEHLPDAISLPLQTIDKAVEQLDRHNGRATPERKH
jgi:rhodanese-related sulfurtransferase